MMAPSTIRWRGSRSARAPAEYNGDGRAFVSTNELTAELVERCADLLVTKNWPERLSALMQMHDQLRDDINDVAAFGEIFPKFVEGVIMRLGAPTISTFEQAQIYANSANKSHRDAAGIWIGRHYDKTRTRKTDKSA
jgi:hypothetical protein